MTLLEFVQTSTDVARAAGGAVSWNTTSEMEGESSGLGMTGKPVAGKMARVALSSSMADTAAALHVEVVMIKTDLNTTIKTFPRK